MFSCHCSLPSDRTMETERGVPIPKLQHRKRPSRLSMPGINYDEIRRAHSPLLLSPRGPGAAAAAAVCDGGASSSRSSVKSPRWRNCLCSPTTHAGSFRCRFHRSSDMPRRGSVGSNLLDLAAKSGAPVSGSALAQ